MSPMNFPWKQNRKLRISHNDPKSSKQLMCTPTSNTSASSMFGYCNAMSRGLQTFRKHKGIDECRLNLEWQCLR